MFFIYYYTQENVDFVNQKNITIYYYIFKLKNYNILPDINNENNLFQNNINLVTKTTFYLNLEDITEEEVLHSTEIKEENKKIIKEEKEEAEVEEMEKEEVEEKEMEKEEVEEENYDILTSFKITEKIITYIEEKYIYRDCYDAIISEKRYKSSYPSSLAKVKDDNYFQKKYELNYKILRHNFSNLELNKF